MKIFGVKLTGIRGTVKEELDTTIINRIENDIETDCVAIIYKNHTKKLYNFVEIKHDW